MTADARLSPGRMLCLLLLLSAVFFLGSLTPGHSPSAQAGQTATVAVELSPSVLVLPGDGTVAVAIDAGPEEVAFARVELVFDPAVVALDQIESSASLEPMPSSTLEEANTTGRLVVAQSAPPGEQATGRFSFATLHFSPATQREEQQTELAVDLSRTQIVARPAVALAVAGPAARLGVNPAPVTCLAVAAIPSGECEALKALYSGTGGSHWGNWFSTDAACREWTGVSCAGGHVTGLSLAGRGLEGTIPAAIGALPHLERLDLAHNRLGGTLPAEMGELGALRHLDLHANRFGGPVPSTLSGLTSLTDLDLGYNLLSAPDPQLASFLNARDPDWLETQAVPPAGLAVAQAASNSLVLSWQPVAAVDAAGFYELYLSPAADGPYTFVARTEDLAADHYLVEGLTPDSAYFFKIRTLVPADAEQPSERVTAYSGVAPATTTLPPPAAVSASRGTYGNHVRITWDSVPGATAYNLYRRDGRAAQETLLTTVTGTAFEDRSAAAGEVYVYWLSTCNDRLCSELSAATAGWHGDVSTSYIPLVGR